VFVPTRALLDNILGTESVDHAGATHPLLALGLVGLFKVDHTPTVDSVKADFTEADYNTYARQAAAAWSIVGVTAGGLSVVRAANFHIQMTDTLKAQTIFGAMLLDAGGTVLLGAERFDSPVPLGTVLDFRDYLLTFGFDPSANFGLGVIG
jgi:hypothetical protein